MFTSFVVIQKGKRDIPKSCLMFTTNILRYSPVQTVAVPRRVKTHWFLLPDQKVCSQFGPSLTDIWHNGLTCPVWPRRLSLCGLLCKVNNGLGSYRHFRFTNEMDGCHTRTSSYLCLHNRIRQVVLCAFIARSYGSTMTGQTWIFCMA